MYLTFLGRIAILFVILFFGCGENEKQDKVTISGQTMGSIVYRITYISDVSVTKNTIDSLLNVFNQSLSTYIPDSEVSKLNANGHVNFTTPFLRQSLNKSKEVYGLTHGAFDPTVGPLVSIWGFGINKHRNPPDSSIMDSLKNLTGFDKVRWDSDYAHLPKGFNLDFSAVAKGQAVDVLSDWLEQKNIKNYLVEIGGEVRCKGKNDKGKSWSLGIEDPKVKAHEQKILVVVRIENRALATSGNYRNFYEDQGITYAHIIDPRKGYPTRHRLLSASVFTKECATADAYATAFMVLGLEQSKQIVEKTHALEAIFIYTNKQGTLSSYVSTGIQPFVELNKAL